MVRTLRKVLIAGVAGLVVGGCVTRVVYIDRPTGTQVPANQVENEREREVPRLPRTVVVHGTGAINVSISYATIVVRSSPQATEITGTVQLSEVVPNDAEVSLTQEGLSVTSKGGHPISVGSAVFVVPAQTPATLHTSQGDITVSGLQKVERIDVSTSSGAITASDCHEVGELILSSSYGNLTLASADARTMTLKSGQGSMDIRDIKGLGSSPALKATASSGAITMRNCPGFTSIDAKSSYGNLELTSAGPLVSASLTSGQGSTHVSNVKGEGNDAKMAVTASSGAITLENCTGFVTVDATTSYGEVTVAAVSPVNKMAIKSGQGSTRVADVTAKGDLASLSVLASSGAINIQKCSGFSAMSASTSYGDVSIRDLESVGQLTASSGQGSSTVESIRSAGTVQLSANSGSATARNLTVTQSLSLKTGYGALVVEGCESPATQVQSSQGEIGLRRSKLGRMSIKGRVSSVDWDNVAIEKVETVK